MNAYGKWGIRYVNSFMRHLLATTSLWGLYEVKYQEVNWHDLGWAILVGAVIPTLKELFSEGIPVYGATAPATKDTVNETKPTPPPGAPVGP